GTGLPEGVNKGFYVRPTIFADVTPDMTIAREEIFGPVLTIIGAKDEAEAVHIANDTPYGLAGYVSADTVESAKRVARQIRAGNVNLQGVPNDRSAPFGGYKQSGNGREWGKYGLEDYLEVKGVAGFNAAYADAARAPIVTNAGCPRAAGILCCSGLRPVEGSTQDASDW